MTAFGLSTSQAERRTLGDHPLPYGFRPDPNPDIRAPSPAPHLQTLVHLRAEWPCRMIDRHGCREWAGKSPSRSTSYRMPTAPSAQIANAAKMTPQTRDIRKTDWLTNRTISSIAKPTTAKMAAAALKSAPVQRTSSVNNMAMAGRRSKPPRQAQRARRQRPRLAARQMVDTVTEALHRG